MGKIKFSIVVPVYQKELFLKKCIDSLLAQIYKDFEIIFVDDGSIDRSGEICDDYAKIDSRVVSFHKTNGGVSAARNYGIEKSNYKYIAFIDADDFWEKDFLSEIVYLIKKYPQCGMYSTGFNYVINDSTEKNKSGIIGDCVIDNYFKHSLKHRIVNSSNVVIRNSILEKVGSFPVGMIDAEDLYTWAKVASVSKLAYSDKMLSSYNLDSEGWRLRKDKKDIDGYSYTQLLDGEPYKTEYLSMLAYEKAIYYLINGFKQEADKQIAPFIRANPFGINMIKYQFYRLFSKKIIFRLVMIDKSVARKINLFQKLIISKI